MVVPILRAIKRNDSTRVLVDRGDNRSLLADRCLIRIIHLKATLGRLERAMTDARAQKVTVALRAIIIISGKMVVT